MQHPRKPRIVVISDIHLGTYGSHAKELVAYLKSINPQYILLNGDIIDMWNFSKRYFPNSHLEVLKQLLDMATRGVQIKYITGNHDELLRRYTDLSLGNIEIIDKLVMEIDGKKVWIFHGDVFDNTTQGKAKLIAKLGGKGYDLLILINRAINYILSKLGRPRVSISQRVKNGVKGAVKFINNFEQVITDIAIEKGYDYVICGHIHKPEIRTHAHGKGTTTYMNSGDWVENLSALEYSDGIWSIYQHTASVIESTKNRDSVFPEKKELKNRIIS